jgi:hypothetical protein
MGNVDEKRDANGRWSADSVDMKAVKSKTSNVHTLSKDEQELSDLEDAGMIHTQEMGDDGEMHDIDFANSDD